MIIMKFQLLVLIMGHENKFLQMQDHDCTMHIVLELLCFYYVNEL